VISADVGEDDVCNKNGGCPRDKGGTKIYKNIKL
jgi:hypothetical protein